MTAIRIGLSFKNPSLAIESQISDLKSQMSNVKSQKNANQIPPPWQEGGQAEKSTIPRRIGQDGKSFDRR
jgi:hypothetical protein